MAKEKIKFLDFVLWVILSMIVFGLIFFYIKFYSCHDTIINFIPTDVNYYLHIDFSNHHNTSLKKDFAREIMTKEGFSSELIQAILTNIHQELALADINNKKILFFKSKKNAGLINLLEIAEKPYKKINTELIAISENQTNLEFNYHKNKLLTQLQQIKFSGPVFYWGFIKQEKLKELFFMTGSSATKFLKEINNSNNLVFVSRRDRNKLRFRLGEMTVPEDYTLWASGKNINTKSELKRFQPLINKLDSQTILAVGLDNFFSLKDYINQSHLNLIIKDLPEKYRIDLKWLEQYLKTKSQLNIFEDNGQKRFLLTLRLDQKDFLKQAAKIEETLKNIILLTFIQEEEIVLPDKTTAKQLVAPIKELVQEEDYVNKEKIIAWRLPKNNFELAYAFNNNKLLISDSKKIIKTTITTLGISDFDRLLSECFIRPGNDVLYLKNNDLNLLSMTVTPFMAKSLVLTNLNQGFLKGLEACIY